MSIFLPLLDADLRDDALLTALSRIGPLIVPSNLSDAAFVPQNATRYILVDTDSSLSPDEIISLLDRGADKVIVPPGLAKGLAGTVPAERLLLLLDVANVSAVSDTVRNGVSGVLIKSPSVDVDFIGSFSRFFAGSPVHVLPTASTEPPSRSTIRGLHGAKTTLVIPTSLLTLATTDAKHINVADAFLARITSDRKDGLFPTVVSSYLDGGRTLGLVYSSYESVKESIVSGKGVYQSRKHGLWRKGETSGATQDIVSIRLDCDADALEFSVVQHGTGFCHLERQSCFGTGELTGLAALEHTLQSRLEAAPEGSYTRRLFEDPALLRSKIMEEADELCRAQTKEEVAFEAADLLYFALTRCVAEGVTLADVGRTLDNKAKKVTRRPGNAKPQWSQKLTPGEAAAHNASTTRSAEASDPPARTPPAQATVPAPGPAPAAVIAANADPEAPIRMRTYDLSAIAPAERAQLLRRPVLKSDEMIAKVRPIVEHVRAHGDAALLELTAKFDKAQLASPVIRPPFAPETMELPDDVRRAIDVAYANIYKFHKAQSAEGPLTVETMPGVVCSRFARPIARVGLYVPGGTAILPSTALMLGIPAQVAGCKEIVLATPPRPDGSVSPEVMYVAQLVGASAILRAGGAQAVAALAYGTATVPKVDKIFGPGNQWVTAAKMLVQNDTDALVAIDMPAGPSEVLVIADRTADAAFVAADLLSQAEHGVDSQVVLVAVDLPPERVAAIEAEVDRQARALTRVDIMRQSIPKSIIVRAGSLEEAIAFSNDYAPEHLILHLENAPAAVALVDNAGSVFVGPYSPESCGDYASGTNHTLPTNGYARQFSGVNTLSFQKHITSQEVTADGLKSLGPVVATLADCEGLDAHANAVRIRLRALA
ncbi:histidine biosynthesis trifunctional-protein [Dichomitus squalens]|uniref:Histidine biosynthesis trifunctional protein n=1 Tax=Dichomitus squalens TaxID=114155 RepID=A0A4Q9QBC3_9APHY|nr:histidine biosynthesis trifunctional-protein [Dichomitus squalens]TBU63934.1 histidine biosynthesis trifunctional-protein [Dichomitus squalens]